MRCFSHCQETKDSKDSKSNKPVIFLVIDNSMIRGRDPTKITLVANILMMMVGVTLVAYVPGDKLMRGEKLSYRFHRQRGFSVEINVEGEREASAAASFYNC